MSFYCMANTLLNEAQLLLFVASSRFKLGDEAIIRFCSDMSIGQPRTPNVAQVFRTAPRVKWRVELIRLPDVRGIVCRDAALQKFHHLWRVGGKIDALLLRVILSRQQRAIKTKSSTHKSRKYLHSLHRLSS